MLVTWITLELTELSEGTMDWLPTGTSAISMVEPGDSDLLRADDKINGMWLNKMRTKVTMHKQLERNKVHIQQPTTRMLVVLVIHQQNSANSQQLSIVFNNHTSVVL